MNSSSNRAMDGEHAAGFTLIELMVASLILLGGVTAVLQLFSLGVSTRRDAEVREQAVYASQETIQGILRETLRMAPMDPDDGLPRPEDIPQTPLPNAAGMRYSVRFVSDPDRIDLLLAVVEIRWRQEGNEQTQTLHRVLRRHRPFPVRVAELQESASR